MIQQQARAVYAWLDSWADGTLLDLATRIGTAMPQTQLRALVEGWPVQAARLSELQPGRLRPAVSDTLGQPAMLDAGLRLLLYTNEVVIDHDILQPRWDERRRRLDSRVIARDVSRLATLRPLVEDGSILFSDARDHWKGVHPSRRFAFLSAMRSVPADRWDPSEEQWDIVGPEGLASAMAGSLVAAEQRRATPLALTKNEQLAFEAVLSGHLIDSRPTELRKLATLSVPSFSTDPGSLVALRSNSDSLHEFRQALTVALLAVAEVPDNDGAVSEATAIMADALSAQLENVRKDAEGSLFSGLGRGALRRLTFSGIGTAATSAVTASLGMPVLGAVAGAVGTTVLNGAETVRELLSNMKSRRGARAIWDVVTEFRS